MCKHTKYEAQWVVCVHEGVAQYLCSSAHC